MSDVENPGVIMEESRRIDSLFGRGVDWQLAEHVATMVASFDRHLDGHFQEAFAARLCPIQGEADAVP